MHDTLSKNFWNSRRVFVTGHTGFKGGWLTALLNRLGAQAGGYSLAPATVPCLYEVAGVGELGPSVIGDIRDQDRLRSAMRDAQPEIVFHLAAQALVRPACAQPLETFSTNVMGTAQVLEAVRSVPSVRAVVVVTSDKVYDNVEWAWSYRETDVLGGKEPYGASKACAEIVADAYRYSYFTGEDRKVHIATARAGNVIGGGDWAEFRIVPDAMRSFSADQPLVVRNPAAVRPWQHVLEPLSGYMRLAEALLDGTKLPEKPAFNFGPLSEDALPVSTIADQLVARWGGSAAWRQDQGYQPYEARLLEVDSALARSVLGWRPRWRLRDALDRTVDWYKAHYMGKDMRAFTFAQIDEYVNA